MKDLIPEPERLLDLASSAEAEPGEQRAASLLRGIAEPAALSPELLLRIKSRVAGSAPRRTGTLRLKVLLAAALLIASSGVVFAAQSLWQAAHRSQEIVVPSGASVRLGDARQRHMTLVGAARAELKGDEIALSSGLLALSAGSSTVTVMSGELELLVPAQGVVEVTASAGGGLLVNNAQGVVIVMQHGTETARLSPGQSFRAGHITPLAAEERRAIAQLADTGVRPSSPNAEAPASAASVIAPPPEAAASTPAVAQQVAPEAPLAEKVEKPALGVRDLPAPSSSSAPSSSESRLLSAALVELRRNNDAHAALSLLDQYSAHFPGGSLTPEATRARAEALIALGRRNEALRLLDDLTPVTLGRSMLLVRGELRSELNRCTDALADFSNALSQNPHDSVDERALFGRAMCRAHVGDASSARSDLNQYAVRFPHGRFQVQVERALQK